MPSCLRVSCLVFFFSASGLVARDDKEAELALFEGRWTAVSVERSGKKQDDDIVKHYRLVVKGGAWTEVTQGNTSGMQYNLKIDPSKTPKEIDIGFLSKGRSFSRTGIYKFTGDTLTICRSLGIKDAKRPTDFFGGETFEVVVYKRAEK
jgi:uncharacterized protein (TIGR03067 family)